MLGLASFVAFLVGFFVSNAYQHSDSVAFWLFIGLMLLALHTTFAHVIMARRNTQW